MSECSGLWKHENNQHAFVPWKTECGCPSGGGIKNSRICYPLWRNAEEEEENFFWCFFKVFFLDFFFPQCNAREIGLLFQGKASSHSTALPSFFLFFLCVVHWCLHTTGCEAYSFMTDGYGIFNTCANLGACCTHEDMGGGGGQAQTSLRKSWLRGIEKNNCPSPCPTRGSKPKVFGFEFRLSNHWAKGNGRRTKSERYSNNNNDNNNKYISNALNHSNKL